MTNCKKCGNPQKLYWCAECENSEESDTCSQCGKTILEDKNYHDDCGEALVCTYKNCNNLQTGDGEFCAKHYPKSENTVIRYNLVSDYLNNQTEENWNKLVDYIRSNNLGKKQTLTIPFTENDIQELQSGEEFNWSFETDKGEEIEIYIIHEVDEEYDEIKNS